MISASLPGEALAQLGPLGPPSHLYPPPPPTMTSEFLAPPPRPYARYAPRRRDAMPAPPAPLPTSSPAFPVPGAYAPYLAHPSSFTSYLYRARPQPPVNYPLRPRPSSGFIPPAPAPHSPPVSTPAPAPAPLPPREEPQSPERGAPAPYFCRGALIRLEDGTLRRVEEMRTEDFVMSADQSSDLALTQCTLLRLEEKGNRVAISLTYDRNRAQVELESTVEHPFFVYGVGWASCKPERTLTRYGLRVQKLQVGDVCVSLMAKKHPTAAVPATTAAVPTSAGMGSSFMGSINLGKSSASMGPTSTVTAPTSLGPSSVPSSPILPNSAPPPQTHPENLSVKEAAHKRRWSASDVGEEAPPPLKKR